MGVNQSLCQQQSPYGWCTYQAVDNFTIKIQTAYLVMLAIYAIVILHQFYKLLRYRCSEQHQYMFGDVFVQIFICILLWLSGSIARTALNVFIYYQYMEDTFVTQITATRDVSDGLVVSASVYTFLDFVCSFFINFMMIVIPYQWIKIMLLNVTENKLEMKLRKKIQKFFKVISLVRIYYRYIRLLYLLLLFLQPFFLFFTKFGGCSWPKFNYFYVITESSFILMFYIFCACTAYFLQRQGLIRIKDSDFRRIKIQYFLLLTVLMFRITLNSIFRLSNIYKYTPTENCSDPIYKHKILASIFLSLHHFFMHLLPTAVITYIYRPSLKQRKQQKKLLQNIDVKPIYSMKTVQNNSQIYQHVEREFFRSSLVDKRLLKLTSRNSDDDEDDQ